MDDAIARAAFLAAEFERLAKIHPPIFFLVGVPLAGEPTKEIERRVTTELLRGFRPDGHWGFSGACFTGAKGEFRLFQIAARYEEEVAVNAINAFNQSAAMAAALPIKRFLSPPPPLEGNISIGSRINGIMVAGVHFSTSAPSRWLEHLCRVFGTTDGISAGASAAEQVRYRITHLPNLFDVSATAATLIADGKANSADAADSPSDWSSARSPKDWRKLFGEPGPAISHDTLVRRRDAGEIRVKIISQKSWKVHRDDLPPRDPDARKSPL